MTVPDERYSAIKRTREFLYELLDPKKTPRVPSVVRNQAYWCLRHFPTEMDMENARIDSERTWGDVEPMEKFMAELEDLDE